MIVPIEWLKEYIKIDRSDKEIGEMFTSLGLMIERPVENGILDLEHRMDRSDWLSIVGCARDLAAMEATPLIEPEGFVPKSEGRGEIEIKVKARDLVRRFNTRVFKGVKVEKSPDWLSKRLEQYGISPKNNIVDITNYVMVELGQPMHAQDLSKFSKKEICLRKARNNEKVTTLLGEEVKLDKDVLVLSEGKNVIGIGGIVGGLATSVDENTTDIILDAGNYYQANIRSSSRRLGVRNETVLRTEKFLHPNLTQVAMERATKLILDIAGGKYYENVDYYPKEMPLKATTVRFSRIEKIGGIELNGENVKDLLISLGYKILEKNSAGFKVEVPYFRTDVEVEDDIVSDVLRINDYKNIPLEAISGAPPKEVTSKIYDFEDKCRDTLAGLGLHEHITNPLVPLNKDDKGQIGLLNALDPDHSALRTSICETLRPVLSIYKKHKISDGILFEIGLTYHKMGKKYEDLKEVRALECVISLSDGVKAANDELKRVLSAFLRNLGISNVRYERGDKRAVILQNDLELGELRIDSFTLYTENLLKATNDSLRVRDKLMHKTHEDITIEIEKNAPLGPLVSKALSLGGGITGAEVVSTYNKNGKKAVTLRLTIESAKEIDKDLIKDLKKKLG